MTKFIGSTGLTYLWSKIKTWVQSAFVSNVSISGDKVRVTKNGSNTDLTVPYATKAAQDGDGKVIKNTYVTLGTTQTITGTKYAGGNLFRFNSKINDVFTLSYDDAFSYSPFSWNAWHDHLAFLRVHRIDSVEQSIDGETWEESDIDIKSLFIQKERFSRVEILPKTLVAFRFTLYSTQFHYCGIQWFLVGVSHSNPFSNFTFKVENSADNVDWTTLVEATMTAAATSYFIKTTTIPGNKYYVRFTFTKITNLDTGIVYLNSINGLTKRKGDQGVGKEYIFPFDWDEDDDIFPFTTENALLGLSTKRWANIFSVLGNFSGLITASGGITVPSGKTITVDGKEVLTTHQDVSNKQDTLVSGTNIKTINNESLLGSGNVSITSSTIIFRQW